MSQRWPKTYYVQGTLLNLVLFESLSDALWGSAYNLSDSANEKIYVEITSVIPPVVGGVDNRQYPRPAIISAAFLQLPHGRLLLYTFPLAAILL